jgi:hypothetical protein
VYALACVLYTALSGERPFLHASATGTAWAHLNVRPPRVGSQALDHVIAHGMAKRPQERYATAGELALAAARAVNAPDPEPTVALARAPIARRAPRHRGRRAVVAGALVLALLVVTGIVLAISLRSGRSPVSAARTEVALSGFRFSIPRGWRLTEIEQPMGSLQRTEAVDPDGPELVIIDHSSEPLDVQPWARNVQTGASVEAGYAGVSFSADTISGRQAVVWRFVINNEPLSQRVDVFQRIGTDGYAVLGEAATMSTATALALGVADSISRR